ncbi:MAG: glycosyltransferase family 4 protein [Candidatus Uhrbacteria bacterium]
MKRVLLFSTAYAPLLGGAEVAIREITDRATDFEFDLICTRLIPGLSSTEKIGRVQIHRVGFGCTFDKYLLPFLGPLYAIFAIRYSSFDLLWSMQASYGGFASLFYSWMKPRTRFLLTLQEGDPFEQYAKRVGIFGGLHRAIFRRADFVQVISNFLGDWALKMGFGGKPKLIPNGVDVSRFLYREPHISDQVTLISVSRLSHKNGIDLVIRAMPSLPERVTLRLVGDGEDRVMLENLAKELHVENRVEFLGSKNNSDIPGLLASADIFVRPSRSEGQGISFLESMACGLPTVATPVGGIPDFLNSETGWLCKPEDPESIAYAINQIITTPQVEVARITQNASRLVRESYDWEKIGREMSDLFSVVCASKRVLIATGIYPPESGGPSQYSYGFARSLERLGHCPSVVAYGETKGRVSRSGGPVIRYIRFAWRSWKLARRSDVLFLQGAVSEGFPATIVAMIARKPTVLRLPGDYAWEMAQQSGETDLLDAFLAKAHTGKIGLYEKLERFVARRAKSVIAPSQYLKSVAEKWSVSSEKISVIWNAEHSLPTVHSRDEARELFGVSDKIVCLTVVRAVPWKGVAELIAWWKDIPLDHVLIVGGDGPETEAWKTLAVEHSLSDRVRFVGRLNREVLADWYRASDVFILHSGYEGYPHVVAEAASLGVPCFVSDQGGNPETEEVFGDLVQVFPYQNKAVWVEALTRVSRREERESRPPRWTHEQMVEAVLNVLNI